MSTPLHQPIDHNLLVRFLSGDANEDEVHQVQQWLLADESNKLYLEEMKLIWESSQQLKDFVGIDKKEDWKAVRHRIEAKNARPRSIQALLKKQWPQRLMRIAAAITFLAVAYFTWPVFTEYRESTTLEAPDTMQQFQLPDGSTVYLAKGSRLSYYQDFNKDHREVELIGEAFFEVFKDSSKPFLVRSGPAVTEVVGTSFNVNNTLAGVVAVTVLTGKVELYGSAKAGRKIALAPGEQGVMKEGGRLSKTLNQDLNFLSWKTGELHFRNTPLSQVVQDINRHYHKTIRAQPPTLEGCTLTATFRQREIEEVLEEIQLALPLEVEEQGNTMIIKGKGCGPVP